MQAPEITPSDVPENIIEVLSFFFADFIVRPSYLQIDNK
jgi:hypothetical protein